MKNTMKSRMTSKVTGIVRKAGEAPLVKKVTSFLFMLMVTLSTGSTAFATSATKAPADGSEGADLGQVTKPIIGLINSFVNPLLALVGAGGSIFCIFLGVKYATAEEPQEREKRKQALKTAIIGFVLIFVLIVALKLSINPLKTWMANSTKGK